MSDASIGAAFCVAVFIATSFAALSIAWAFKTVRISRARRIEQSKRMEYAMVFMRDVVSIASGQELVQIRQRQPHQRPRNDVITVDNYDEAMRARQDARKVAANIAARAQTF